MEKKRSFRVYSKNVKIPVVSSYYGSSINTFELVHYVSRAYFLDMLRQTFASSVLFLFAYCAIFLQRLTVCCALAPEDGLLSTKWLRMKPEWHWSNVGGWNATLEFHQLLDCCGIVRITPLVTGHKMLACIRPQPDLM
jgi:hypothetical protein